MAKRSVHDPLVDPPPITLRALFPIIEWLPKYNWGRTFGKDLVAGIALAALLIPESMGYATVAGVPTEVGLYAALAACFVYAITGGTSILVVGPASAVAALSAAVIADFPGDANPAAIAAGLAISSGVLLVLAGLLRLGWIVNFISRPVLHAFVAGLSISIIIGQLDSLLGVEVDGESAVAKLVSVVANFADWQWATVAVGVGAVAGMLLLERFIPRLPAAVIAVAAGISLVAFFGLEADGVEVVGDIPVGLPGIGLPQFSVTDWLQLFAGGFALILVGFSEGYASASSIAGESGEEVDADQELFGSGTANIAAGLVGGLAVGGSLSKSSAAMAAGARSQITNVVAGVIVLATLLFLAPVFEMLPEPILAAVVIVALLHSADPRRVTRLWAVNRTDFAAGLVTFTLVLVWETLPAMVVGVLLSLAFVIRRVSFPDVAELRPDGDGKFHSLLTEPELRETLPGMAGVVVLRFSAPLIYANAGRFQTAAERLIAQHPATTRLVIDAAMFADLDASGAEALEHLDDVLAKSNIELHLARVHRRAQQQIHRSELGPRFTGRIHETVQEATGWVKDPH
ncbi:STAS domain-containing protein [Ornithinimicrobium sp. Arc0846-15]|nr:STAS domain-containing protein [Ornithinimicrobium laminariae]